MSSGSVDPFDGNNPLDAGNDDGDTVATTDDSDTRDLNVSGIISIIVFYLIVLAVGIWAGWRQKRMRTSGSANQEDIMIAGRNIGIFVGVLTTAGKLVNQHQITGCPIKRCMFFQT